MTSKNFTVRLLSFQILVAMILGVFFNYANATNPTEFFKIDTSTQMMAVGDVRMKDTGIIFIVYVTNIDAKKKYADLNSSERMLWRSQYENIPDIDEPPFPEDGLISILRPIAAENVTAQEQGGILMHVEVGVDGNAQKADLYDSPTPELGKFAMTVALRAKYTPAFCNGVRCVMSIPLRIFLFKKNS
jgi:hypothetical protein